MDELSLMFNMRPAKLYLIELSSDRPATSNRLYLPLKLLYNRSLPNSRNQVEF
jgi:hypothetical protein